MRGYGLRPDLAIRLGPFTGGIVGSVSAYAAYALAENFVLPEYWLSGTRYGASAGPELVVNGSFTSGASWTAIGGWSISGGQAVGTGASDSLTQTGILVSGRPYTATFDYTMSSGSRLRINSGGVFFVSPLLGASGSVSINFVAGGADLIIQADNALFTGTLDNVSVKQNAGASQLPGYTFTRSGSQGAVDASGAVAFFAANAPAINSAGYHAYGALTNIIFPSNNTTTQTTPALTAAPYTLSFYGTGTVTLTGASTAGPLVGTGASNRVVLVFTPTAATLTLTVSGTITNAGLLLGNFSDGGPIITTTTAAASIGESLLKHNAKADGTALVDQDRLIFATGTPQGSLVSQTILEINETVSGAANRIILSVNATGGLTALVTAASVAVYSATPSAATRGQKATIVLRRMTGAWRAGKVIAGVLTWFDVGATAAFPTLMTTVAEGNSTAGAAPVQGAEKGGFIKTGTFTTDASVLAAVAETP